MIETVSRRKPGPGLASSRIRTRSDLNPAKIIRLIVTNKVRFINLIVLNNINCQTSTTSWKSRLRVQLVKTVKLVKTVQLVNTVQLVQTVQLVNTVQLLNTVQLVNTVQFAIF